jgi:hypothetical protein
MVNKTLRKLARAHADGSIDEKAYRKARTELIQGILSDQIPLKVIEYPPLVRPPEAESLDDTQQRKREVRKTPANETSAQSPTAPPATTESGDASAPVELTSSSPTNKLLFIGLAVVVIAIIVIIMFAMSGEDDSSKPVTTSSSTLNKEAESTSIVDESTPAQMLIRDFLQKKNWSAASLDNFQQQWSSLATDEVMESLEMGQLTNAIFKQLLDERALSGLVDDDSSLNKQQKLLEFASALGINDERISMPEQLQP